jgi:hypothetical protein
MQRRVRMNVYINHDMKLLSIPNDSFTLVLVNGEFNDTQLTK